MTIGNLELQVRNLVARCEDVVRERDALRFDAIALQDVASKNEALAADMDRAHVRLKGWQDCAREILCNLMVAPVASDK